MNSFHAGAIRTQAHCMATNISAVPASVQANTGLPRGTIKEIIVRPALRNAKSASPTSPIRMYATIAVATTPTVNINVRSSSSDLMIFSSVVVRLCFAMSPFLDPYLIACKSCNYCHPRCDYYTVNTMQRCDPYNCHYPYDTCNLYVHFAHLKKKRRRGLKLPLCYWYVQASSESMVGCCTVPPLTHCSFPRCHFRRIQVFLFGRQFRIEQH